MNDHADERIESMPWAWIRKLNQMVENAEIKFDHALPVEISPSLFLSDEKGALDKEKLETLGITHVLSLNGVPSYQQRFASDFYKNHGITHLRISADDSEGYGMIEKHWKECYDFITLALSTEGNKVIVHCVAGINRSGLISCAAYMVMGGHNVLDAVGHCIEKRGLILSNKSFRIELCTLAAQHDLLGDHPGFSDDPIERVEISPPPIARAFERLF